jgi:glyoxylate/hydroxypyruvate reductase
MGRIAQATLHRLVAFGVRNVVYYSRSPSPDEATLKAKYSLETMKHVSLDELALTSDLVIILIPGGTSTYHMIDDAFLRKCKKTATIVNTARGTVVDSDALALALKEERIWSAGLDVVEGEPNVDTSHPLVKEPRHVGATYCDVNDSHDHAHSRCVIVPHIGSATLETRTAMYPLIH